MTGNLLLLDLPRRQPRRVSDVHPGLVALPGSSSLAGMPSFPNMPGGGPVVFTSGYRASGCSLDPKREGSRTISLSRQFPDYTAQDFTDLHPRLGFDWLRHGSTMEQASVEVVASAYVKARE